MMVHIKKTWERYFSEAWEGRKNFEIREYYDRRETCFEVGDIFVSMETWNDSTGYTNRELLGVIDSVIDYGQPEGQQVLGIRWLAKRNHPGNVWKPIA